MSEQEVAGEIEEEKKEENFIIKELKKYTLRDIVSHPVFQFSLIIGIAITIISYVCAPDKISAALTTILPISIQVSTILTAIVTAGFIMLVSFSKDEVFSKLLDQNDIYDMVLFLFFEPVIWGCVNIIFAYVTLTIISLGFVVTGGTGSLLLGFTVGFFVYVFLGYINIYLALRMYAREKLHYYKQQEELKQEHEN